jgi:GNAT superfamily N-acetyltransferase
MAWQLVAGLAALDAVAGEMLRRDPVAYTVVLGILARQDGGPSTAAVCVEDGAVVGAAWRTPPYPLGITGVTAGQARELAPLIDPDGIDLVVGPAEPARALADALAGRESAVARLETLYRLDATADIVSDPRPRPPGSTRPIEDSDVALLAPWLHAFQDEAGGIRAPDPEDRLRAGGMYVWDDGAVRCLVGGRQTGGGVARIGPVYTPPSARGTGIATACVEDVCRALFGAGTDVVTLFADDANATSTGIYRRLGFSPVLAWAEHVI